MVHGNTGQVNQRTYDDRARLTTDTVSGVSALSYGYDGANNVKSFGDQLAPSSNRTTSYDKVDRLLTATAPGLWGSASYAYDALGNRTAETVAGVATDYTYDNHNRLDTSRRKPSMRPLLLVWDAAGRLASSSDGTQYLYDGHDRRVRKSSTYVGCFPAANASSATVLVANNASVTACLQAASAGSYSVAGLTAGGTCKALTGIPSYPDESLCNLSCTAKNTDVCGGATALSVFSTAPEETLYHYDLGGHIIAETRPDGSKLRDYIYLAGKLRVVDGCLNSGPCTERERCHTDHLGTVFARTDSAGNVAARFQHKPWGERVSAAVSTSADGDRQYNGRVFHSGTGFHDYGARLYWPEIGRFVSADTYSGTIEKPASLNRYSNVLNNPHKYVDTDGRDPVQCRILERPVSYGYLERSGLADPML